MAASKKLLFSPETGVISPALSVCLAVLLFVFSTHTLAAASTEKDGKDAAQEAGEIEEVIVTGSQIQGAAINDALSVSVITSADIDVLGMESGDELLDAMPE